MSKVPVEEDGNNTTGDGGTTKNPDEVWVTDGGRGSEVDNIGDAGVEQVNRRHEATHIHRGARVGNTVGRDVDEELRETTKGIRDGLPPQGDVGNVAFHDAVVSRRSIVAAGASLVSLPAEKGVANTTQSGEEETGRNAGDGAVVNLEMPEEGVESVLKKKKKVSTLR